MTLKRTLDVLAGKLERASSVPLSASCLVNRSELLALVERARSELPGEVDDAAGVLAHRDELLDEAQREALALVDSARRQAGQLVGTHAIVTVAQARADRILDAARAEAARLLRDADEYCDRRLADLEHDLEGALGQARRGRDRLRERSALDRAAAVDPEQAGEEELDEVVQAALDEVLADGAPEAAGGVMTGVVAEGGAEAAPQPPEQRRVLDVAGLEREHSHAD